jgi:hypothetical protein
MVFPSNDHLPRRGDDIVPARTPNKRLDEVAHSCFPVVSSWTRAVAQVPNGSNFEEARPASLLLRRPEDGLAHAIARLDLIDHHVVEVVIVHIEHPHGLVEVGIEGSAEGLDAPDAKSPQRG